jgi:hypothetical protein
MMRLPKLRGNGLHPAQSYTSAELATATGVAETTVRLWIREKKLPALTRGRPHLVLGCDATAFFKSLRSPAQTLTKGEMRCMHCKTGRKPLGAMVDYIAAPRATLARIEGLCEVCDSKMSMGVSATDLPHLKTIFEVQVCGAAGN